MLSESEIILFSKTYNHPIWNCLPIGSIWNSPEHALREKGALRLWHTHCDQTCVYSMECPPFLSFVCMGQDYVGDKCFFVLLWVSHALNSGCQAWGQYQLSQVSGPHVPFSPWALRHSLTCAFCHPYPFLSLFSQFMDAHSGLFSARQNFSVREGWWLRGWGREGWLSTGHTLTMVWLS